MYPGAARAITTSRHHASEVAVGHLDVLVRPRPRLHVVHQHDPHLQRAQAHSAVANLRRVPLQRGGREAGRVAGQTAVSWPLQHVGAHGWRTRLASRAGPWQQAAGAQQHR